MSLGPALAVLAAPESVFHQLQVGLGPADGSITATDQLKLPNPVERVDFWLHPDLTAELVGEGQLERIKDQYPLANYRVRLKTASDQLSLRYHGRIRHALQQVREGMGRLRQQTPGTISSDGVFLSGLSGWYPRIPDTMERFRLEVELPAGWLAVSQGAGPHITRTDGHMRIGWIEDHPQDAITLVAGPFQFDHQDANGIAAQTFLRSPDPELARCYLDATVRYLLRYSTLIGPYPYEKFALVENFWETGYGMPSFTLLGSRVLRLPFILNSSYPHEILHNWWGNSVFVDWETGNWCEGLTAYLADHLNQAIAGAGSAYRHDQLKAYADYVRDGQDIPLAEFRARHGQASQAIGYGKSLMVFHMLRRILGDTVFIQGLRRFYADQRFRTASWKDVQRAFEQESGADLRAFFAAWIQRPGAVELSLGPIQVARQPDGQYRVTGSIRQSQPQAPFPVRIPILVHDEQGQPHQSWVGFHGDPTDRDGHFDILLSRPPLRFAVDPQFDTFRALAPGETPPSLSNLFGAPSGTLVVPDQAPAELKQAYRQLARQWQQGQSGWTVVTDQEPTTLPMGPVWLLGWNNRFLPDVSHDSPDFEVDSAHQTLRLNGIDYTNNIPVLTRLIDSRVVGWLASTDPAALPGLSRKLPHYGKYGYLLFAGTAPEIQHKGQWPVSDSALIHWFTDPHQATDTPLQWPSRPTLIDTNPPWAPISPDGRQSPSVSG